MNKKILFVFDHKYEHLWRDGLWAALNIIKHEYDVTFYNLQNATSLIDIQSYDMILAWGGFGSPADHFSQKIKDRFPDKKIALCLGGYAPPSVPPNYYDIIFYETEWSKDWVLEHTTAPGVFLKLIHAFGVNTDIYTPWKEAPIIWDYMSVGSFSYWKRHHLILSKPGAKMVVGEIQKENWQESFDIISDLLLAGVGISDMVYPTKLRNLYNCAGTIYIPASEVGGGERAVLEARACGKNVEIEEDNPKLKELLNSPVWDQHYYAAQLKKGIELCLS